MNVFHYAIFVSALSLAACGGGGSPQPNPPAPKAEKAFTVKQYAPANATTPTMVAINGANRKFQYWEKLLATGDSVTSEALYKDNNNSVRAFYDDEGKPIRLIDEITGGYLIIRYAPDRTDFLAYDQGGKYLEGMAIVNKGGKFFWAKIKGVPSLSGQITGDLSGPIVGSFSAVATPGTDLDAMEALPENFNTYAAGVAQSQKLNTASYQPQLFKQIQTGGVVMWLGAAAVAAACTVGCPTAAILGTGIVGLGLIVAPEVFKAGFNKSYDIGTNLLEDISSDKTFLESIKETFQPIFDSAALTPSNAITVSQEAGDIARDTFDTFTDPNLLPQPTDGPPRMPSSVDGYAVDSQNRTYGLAGSIDPLGTVNISGVSPQAGNLSISGALNGGDFSGSYSSPFGNGVATGVTAPIGQCQTQQASGGQGTFTKAYSMGTTKGMVDFSYEAYSIPDAFTLQTNGAVVFSTGGLVSGNGATSIQLTGSPVVFVSVSAPQSGTKWDYSIGCPR